LCAIVDDPFRKFFENLKSLSSFFDFSTLPQTHELYDTINECKPGYWKTCSLDILEVISIQQKNYSVLLKCQDCDISPNQKCVKCQKYTKSKEVPRPVLNRLNHEVYRQLLLSEGISYIKFNTIRSFKHQVGIYKSTKIGFHSLNPSRYLNKNQIDATVLGHFRLGNKKP